MASSPTLTPNSLGTSDNLVNLDHLNNSKWEESSWVMAGMILIWQKMVYNLLARQWEEILAERAQDGMEWEYEEEYCSGEWIIEEVASMNLFELMSKVPLNMVARDEDEDLDF